MKFELYPYQEEGVEFIEKCGGRALIGDDMGIGKTLQALTYLHRHPEIERCLVVCPASVKWNWQNECMKFYGMRAVVLEGANPPKKLPKCRILIINYDILNHHKAELPWISVLIAWGIQYCIFDESHALMSKSSGRTKAAKRLAAVVPQVVCLSGTPMLNRPVELWPTLDIIQPNKWGSSWSFAHRYGKPKKKPWGWTFEGASNVKELHERLQGVMIRRRKCDVLPDLPIKTTIVTPVDITGRKQYQRAELAFLEWLKDNHPDKVKKAQRAEGLMRAGYLKRLVAKLKLKSVIKWVQDFLENSDEKLLLFCIHKQVVKELEKKFSKVCTKITGAVKGRERQQSADRFRNVSKCRLMIGNIRAAGTGWNAEFCSNVVFTEMDWVPGLHLQASDRCHRVGSKNAVTITYLVGKETMEERLARILERKQKVCSRVLDGGDGESLDIYSELCRELTK